MADLEKPEETVDPTVSKSFEAGWASGAPEPIERFLPAKESPQYLNTLEELVHVELQWTWQRWRALVKTQPADGLDETIAKPPNIGAYLKRFPRLDRPEVVRRLVYHEYSLRKESGENVLGDEYRRRFPHIELTDESLELVLPLDSGQMDETLPAGAAVAGQSNDTIGTPGKTGVFGNYDVLEEIGRGGMGVVYRARQRAAGRIVALKVLRPDRLESLPRDTQTSAMDRFRHEAQAAARLEHDHIVTVYEVGQVDDQQFFSMQYVEGRTLAQMLRDGPIPNRQAAAYLEPIARAVHEAHIHGILHRDLKPQNILVDGKTDRTLVADFGVAKLAEGQEQLTQAGEVMGTPSYMSPEQARDSADVTALTDVYALGATLYHILTARPPFQAATPVETLRQVIDEEPAPPRQLNPSIDRDLETICLKCLQKELGRRYASAALLADDLGHYLRGEPIVARPIGPFGRTVRWCRRNPVTAFLLGSTATLLVLALVIALVGYVKTSAALQKEAESFQQARSAVDSLLKSVSEEELLDRVGMQPLRRKLLAQARDYYRQFVAQRGDDPDIQDELADSNFRVGRITEEVDSAEDALPAYQRAREAQQRLLAERPGDPGRLEALGNTLNAIGSVLVQSQRLDEASNIYAKAIAIRRQLAEADPGESEHRRALANSSMNLGLVEKERGDFSKARRQFQQAQAIRDQLLDRDPKDSKVLRDLGIGHYNLAILALLERDYTEAEERFHNAIAVFEKLLQSGPTEAGGRRKELHYHHYLTLCYRLLADLKSVTGDRKAALDLYRKALAVMEPFARASPAVRKYQAELAAVYLNLGLLLQEEEDTNAALESLQQGRDVLEKLVEEYGDVASYRRDLAASLRTIGLLQTDEQAALANLKAAREHLLILVRQFPGNVDFQAQLDKTEAALKKLVVAEESEDQ